MELRIVKAIKRAEEGSKKSRRKKVGWWDGECEELKKNARRELREWRKKKNDRKYKERKKNLKSCVRGRKKKRIGGRERQRRES